jgi:hypothetical protein
MANEITVLEGNGAEVYSMLFLYPIAAPKAINGTGVNVVPTPSSGLPYVATVKLSQAEKDALDAGTSAFEVTTFSRIAGMTTPQLIGLAQALYAARLAEFTARYTERYRYVGVRLNAS